MKQFIKNTATGKIVSNTFIISAGLISAVLGAVFVLVWKKLTNTSFRSLGLFKPSHLLKTIVIGVVAGLLLKLFSISLLMPAIGYVSGSTGTFDFLQGNLTYALLMCVYVIITAGFSEEIVFRGFFFRQFESWFGDSLKTKITMIIIGSLLFGIPHIYQGYYGAFNSVIIGAAFGTMYLMNKKNLWLVMISHTIYDFFSIYIIYNDLSQTMSNLIF